MKLDFMCPYTSEPGIIKWNFVPEYYHNLSQLHKEYRPITMNY